MKTIIFLLGTFIATSTFAGTTDGKGHYCAKTKDGKLTVMHNNKELTEDQTLSNGTKIKTDGTVVKNDGSTMVLKAGECVDLDGKVITVTKKEGTKSRSKKNNPY